MSLYMLTDRLHSGEVIQTKDRNQYRFEFGPDRWIRTTLMLAYWNDESPLYDCYEEIDRDKALELLRTRKMQLLRQLERARELAAQAAGGDEVRLRRLAESTPVLQEKIVLLLHGSGADPGEDFLPPIRRALELLREGEKGDYSRLERDTLARAVCLLELQERREELSAPELAALRRLLGESPEPAATGGFRSSMDIYRDVCAACTQGRKQPVNVSNPVFHKEDGIWMLAFFVISYTRADLQEASFSRPNRWILADLENGTIQARLLSQERDFSSLERTARLSAAYPNRPENSRQLLEEAYRSLDEVRRDTLRTGEPDSAAYEAYLRKMLETVPPNLRQCYRELSSL